MPRRLLPLALCAIVLAGCGAEEAESLRTRLEDEVSERRARVEQRVEEVRAEARSVGERLAERVRDALEEVRRTVPAATEQTRSPTVQGRDGPTTIDAFLQETIAQIDRYWTRTFEASGLPEPRVGFRTIPPDRVALSGCGGRADDRAAFYCPADDTIYVGQVLAAEVYRGIARGFPGESAGQGRAVGDFGAAYIVAHEYAHNLQAELGFLQQRRGGSAQPFELQADCLAGSWGNSVYQAGRLQPGDVEEALSTALAVGDFEVGSVEHHGTPEQRRDAWLLGFESGEPSTCSAFVRA